MTSITNLITDKQLVKAQDAIRDMLAQKATMKIKEICAEPDIMNKRWAEGSE